MTVSGLDHVTILTEDLAGTARFYAEVLELGERDPPAPLDPATIRWMHDRAGRAILHLNAAGRREGTARAAIGGPTGAIDHVALACVDLAAMLARLDRLGIARRVIALPEIGVTQIFIHDPNRVRLELTFRDAARR